MNFHKTYSAPYDSEGHAQKNKIASQSPIGRIISFKKITLAKEYHDLIEDTTFQVLDNNELPMKPYRRKSWPEFVQMSEQVTLEQVFSQTPVPNEYNDELSTRIKNFFINKKVSLKEFLNNARDKVKLKFSPVL
ncbi:unnamed protein product, partial [Meganyctiphanes norvegica]